MKNSSSGFMDITPAIPEGRQVISAYGDGRFRISGTVWEQPVLVFPTRTIPWEVSTLSDVTEDSLAAVFSADPAVEVLLLSTGLKMALPPPALRQALQARGLAFDVMDTGAACRTYNVLVAEDRRVAVALLPV
ncbi:Mth938-like domain-containing protein [Novispirillum itersonii]|uniref:Mth938-like domain-containing protein n=1 Tax=Novispirillum itersonii TaxID=189 RepID=A0A7W9ZEF3_NOVIT|nr:Mth938-like domain-containing protein [Novispirillum itersonii]MBB6209993.1 uncharacterized protein [Novispirillum itersonii]